MVLLAITSTFENNCWSGAFIPALCFCPRKSSMTCLSSIRIKNLLHSVFTSFPTNYFGSVRTSLIENDGSPFKLVLIGTCNWEFLRLSHNLGSRFSNKIINNHSTCVSYQMLGSKIIQKLWLKTTKINRIHNFRGSKFRSCLAGWSGLRFLMRLQVRCWLGLQYPCQKCSCTWLHGCPICADCWLKTLLSSLMGISEGLLECPHGMAAGLPRVSDPWDQAWNCDPFYDLGSEVKHLLHSQAGPP